MALYSLTDGLLFSTGEEKPKKQLPNHVTLPRRGPLILQTTQTGSQGPSTGPSTHRDTRKRVYTNHQHSRHSLTRFPVVTAQRPFEEIERELGEMSCAELWENIQTMDDWPQRKSTLLTHLHPVMKYSPMCSHLHSNTTRVRQYVHHDQGPLNVSITYSRHFPTPYSLPHTTSGYRHTRAYTHPSVSKFWTGNGTKTPPSSSFHAKAETEPGWRFVSQKSPRQNCSVHTTLAPHALQAVTTHRLKPITADTVVRGKKIRTPAS